MKQYQTPKIEIIHFETEDVLNVSVLIQPGSGYDPDDVPVAGGGFEFGDDGGLNIF